MSSQKHHLDEVPLAEMIQTLRTELQRAQAGSTDAEILFKTEKVELELQVAVSRKTKGEGGVEFWVVKAGGEHERTGATTHTFRLSLTPVTRGTDRRVRVAYESEDPLSRK
ncbi:MAG: trypco2 family protein [Candidatus Hodarchaeota archaeon]